MAFPAFTIKDLAEFNMQEEDYYAEGVLVRLTQASLLFRLGTCLKEMPKDPDQAELAKNAILAMATKLYEQDKYSEMKYSPFSSESIGSYSYSKMTARVQAGEHTGIDWFDMAVSMLGQCDPYGGTASSGGYEVFEHDLPVTGGQHEGNMRPVFPSQEVHTGFSWRGGRW